MEDKFVITEINRIVMVGENEYSELYSSFSHAVRNNELIFHFSGYATVYFDDLILETAPDTIRFLPAGEVKRYDVLRHKRGTCIDVCFKADRPVASEAFVINVSQNEKLGAMFKKIFATWVSKKEGYYFESLSLLYRILAELQKENHSPVRHGARIAPAVEMIHNNFLSRDIAVGELAQVCGMGESYFQKLFKEKYGMAPKRYMIQLKVNHACDLLRSEQYSVTQVAELCNFSDVYFFSRQFKEYMGISPTQFVKKYRSSR